MTTRPATNSLGTEEFAFLKQRKCGKILATAVQKLQKKKTKKNVLWGVTRQKLKMMYGMYVRVTDLYVHACVYVCVHCTCHVL